MKFTSKNRCTWFDNSRDKNSPYVNILVAREDNKNAENVKEFLQSYQSSEVAKAAETIFNGGAVPGW